MLIDVNVRELQDPATASILSMIAGINGNSVAAPRRLQAGMYERGDFGSSRYLPGFEDYPDFGDERGCYGVCDDPAQVLAMYPELEAPGREFVVFFTPVVKAEQSAEGGWRWHKWGEYIGTREPQCEYLHDEPSIDRVLCFHIYERSSVPA